MKNLLPFLIIILTLLPSIISSQNKPNFVGEWYQSKAQGKSPVRAEPFTRGQSDFVRTKRYNLKANMNQLNSILNTKPELVNLVIPFGQETYTLNLSRTEILTEDFTVQTGKGQSRPNTGVQYRGIVNNNPEHIASMSLTKTDKSIFFSTNEGNIVVAKEGNDFIVYNDRDQQITQPLFCETLEADVEMPSPRMMALETGCKIVKVYFECDYALYQSKGNSVSNVSDYVMGFFNQVATLYANENINIQISQIYTWTTTDPYATLTTPSAIMNQFKTTKGTNFNGNLAHFLTTRNVGGGIAYVDVICSKAFAFGVSRIYTTYSTVPTYSWTVNVVTHELGHNLGSPHTHSCTWSGGPIDNCHAVEGTCSPGPPPVNGGTIMSYCHTITAGINFNHGFGTQPGNLIRTKVQNATCLESSSGSTPPASLTTTNITSTSATLNWAAVAGTSSYTAQYKLASASTWIPAGSTSSTSINITGLTAASNYVWSVKADCSPFSTNASFTTTGTTSCAAPAQLTSTNILQTGATLNWGAVTGATGYTVQYKPSASTTWTTVNTTINTTALTGLTANTIYNWQVKANCSGYATGVNFTTSSSGCSAPGQLASTAITQNGATLTWGLVTGSTGYTVQYKASSATTWTTMTTALNNLVLTGLTAGTTYQWQVKASCSGYSLLASFSTATSSGCAAPGSLATTSITQTGATLSWGAIAGATSYTIQYKTTPATTWTSATSTTTSRSITGLTAGTSYVWQVKASCSPYSAQTSFTTATSSGCSAPGQLTSSNVTSSGATLGWAAVSGATGYTLQYKKATASTWTTVSSTTTSRTITGLTAGTAYVWQVKANCSVYSSQASFTTTSSTGCAVPTNMTASSITSTAATLSWAGPSNGLTYSIRYRPVGFSGWTIKSGLTGNSFRVTGLISKRNYEWVINTQCSNGTSSAFSSPRQFTTL